MFWFCQINWVWLWLDSWYVINILHRQCVFKQLANIYSEKKSCDPSFGQPGTETSVLFSYLLVTHCEGEVVCSKYSVLRLPGTNMNVQFNRQIKDAVAFPVPAFSGFHKGHTNMNKQTTLFSHIKQEAAVLVRNVPGLYFYYLSTIFAEYIYVCIYKYTQYKHTQFAL